MTTPTAAAGTAVGMGLVRAFDAAELKNLHFYQDQPKPGQIKSALQ
jgi:K+-transporting ATPase A subunit